jgi:hypothetical protein
LKFFAPPRLCVESNQRSSALIAPPTLLSSWQSPAQRSVRADVKKAISYQFFGQITSAPAAKAVEAAKKLVNLKLSDINSDAGIIERLLLAESRTPYGYPKTFDKTDTQKGMDAIGACIVNRVASQKFPNTIKGVITDKKNGVQFKGFDTYPKYDTDIREKLIDVLKWANTKNAKQQDYRDLITYAQTVAQQVINKKVSDPFKSKGGTYFLRTEGSSPPGPDADMPFLGSLGGNSFYSLKSP